MEAMNIAATMYSDVMYRVAGSPEITTPARSVELPSIEPTLDGWVGVNTNSRQQFSDFCVLIERPELADDAELATAVGRKRRMDEWNKAVREFTTQHTTDEVVERGTLLRIPIAPVNDGRGALQHEHLRARGVFVRNPDSDFEQPRPAYLVDGSSPALRASAPHLGEHSGKIERRERPQPHAPDDGAVLPPLAGLRVL